VHVFQKAEYQINYSRVPNKRGATAICLRKFSHQNPILLEHFSEFLKEITGKWQQIELI